VGVVRCATWYVSIQREGARSATHGLFHEGCRVVLHYRHVLGLYAAIQSPEHHDGFDRFCNTSSMPSVSLELYRGRISVSPEVDDGDVQKRCMTVFRAEL
jgi:hypothetical protein